MKKERFLQAIYFLLMKKDRLGIMQKVERVKFSQTCGEHPQKISTQKNDN